MKSIRQTKIFKSLAQSVRKKDHAILAEQLKIARTAPSFCDHEKLSFCFVWYETKQGHAFWRELSRRIRQAGFTND